MEELQDEDVTMHEEMQHKIADTLIGYARVDMLALQDEKRLEFGLWNQRKLNPAEVRKLVESFSRGIHRYSPKNLIPIILSHRNLKGKVSTVSEPTTKLPLLGPQDFIGSIAVASGQHRVAALRAYRQIEAKELEDMNKSFMKLTSEKTSKAEEWTANEEAQLKALGKRIKEAKAKQQHMGRWGVAIYDSGMASIFYCDLSLTSDIEKLTHELKLHLSRNEHMHSFQEQEAERWQLTLAKLQLAADDSAEKFEEELAVVQKQMKKQSSQMSRLYGTRTIVRMLMRFRQLGETFTQWQGMKIGNVENMICVHGGVSLCCLRPRRP